MAWFISSARWFRSSALRARLVSESLYAMSHPAPYRLRKKSWRAKPMRDVGMCGLWFFRGSLCRSTRHFLIRTWAGSYICVSGAFLFFLRLYLGVHVEPCASSSVGSCCCRGLLLASVVGAGDEVRLVGDPPGRVGGGKNAGCGGSSFAIFSRLWELWMRRCRSRIWCCPCGGRGSWRVKSLAIS